MKLRVIVGVVWLFTIFEPLQTATPWDVGDIHEVQKREGAVFLKKGHVLLTGDSWTLTLDLTYKPYQWAAQTIIEESNKFLSWVHYPAIPHPSLEVETGDKDEGVRFSNPLIQHYKEEARHLKVRATKLLENILQLQLVSAIPYTDEDVSLIKPRDTQGKSPRNKRGMIDIGGKALKWLFGTATDADLEKLSQKIDEIHTEGDDLVHLLQEQASVLNISAKNIKKNREDIKSLTEVMKKLTAETQTLKNQLTNTSWSIWKSLVSTGHIQISFRRVNVALLELQDEIMSLVQALETTAQNRLSPYLVPPNQLFQILQNISLGLPGDLTFAIPLSPDSTFMYYHWSDVKTLALEDRLRIFVAIPLKTFDRKYDLFQIIPIPITIGETSWTLIRNPKVGFIAISSDRQSFLELNDEDLSNCLPGPFVVCRPKSAIRVRPASSCAYEVFMGNPNLESCEKQLLHHTEPQFFRLSEKGVWFYVSSYPVRLTIQCPTQDQKRNTYETQEKELKLSGILSIPAPCSAHAPGYLLPSSYTGHLDIKSIQHIDIEIPDISKILNDSQITLLQKVQNNSLFDSVLKKLEKVQQRKLIPSGIPLAEIETDLAEIEKKRQAAKPMWEDYWSPKYIPAPISLLLAILIVVGVIWLIRRHICKKTPRESKISPNVIQGQRRRPPILERRPTPGPQRRAEGEEAELTSLYNEEEESNA